MKKPRRPALREWALVALAVGLAASITLSEIALAVLAVSLFWPRRGRPSRPIAPLIVPAGAFAVWTIASALASARPLESLVASRTLVWLGTIHVLANALADRGAARRWVTLVFAFVSVAAGLAIVQVAFCPATEPALPVVGRFFHKCGRAHGFFSIYMTLAGVLTLVLVAVLPGLGMGARRRARDVLGWLVGVVALGLTLVRGAWLGFLVGVVGCAFVLRRRAAALLAVAVVLIVAAAATPMVIERIRTVGKATLDDTARDRLAMLAGGLRIARDHPVTGIGPGQVKHVYPRSAPPEALRRSTSHLHNTPLQILVERGVVGLALWLALFTTFFARAARILRRLPPEASDDRALVGGAIAAVAAFLVAGLFEYNFGDTEVLLVACALMALPFVVERDLTAGESEAALPASVRGDGRAGAR